MTPTARELWGDTTFLRRRYHEQQDYIDALLEKVDSDKFKNVTDRQLLLLITAAHMQSVYEVRLLELL